MPCYISTGYLCSNYEFDPATGVWTPRADIPDGGGALPVAPAQTIGGQFYLVGVNDRALTPAFHRYDAATNVWTRRSDMLSLGIGGMSAVVGSKLFVYYANGDVPGDISTYVSYPFDVYDAATDTWSRLQSPPVVHQNGTSAAVNGKVYLVGDDAHTGTVSIYDPIAGTWAIGATMPNARDGNATAVGFGGKLYYIGGFRWSPLGPVSNVDIYDPSSNTWSAGPPLPEPREVPAVVVLSGNICVIGGWTRNAMGSVPIQSIVCMDPTASVPVWR
jgi:N-acetylneuraminic acid mutarotase